MHGRYSCALIGNGSLAILCGQKLLEEGYQIAVVITSDQTNKEWAASNNIPTLESKKEVYTPYLAGINFDYLFSIVHLEVIPKEVLELAGRLCVNYHDGPLPAYAGVHATSWALMNQERTHGITWHEMTPVVDDGRILVQRDINIDPGETAFSLNLKCYEAAIESFDELIGILAKDNPEFIEQNKRNRTYFSKYRRPNNMGIIPWQESAESALAFINALNFGGYDNPLATPKFVCNGQFYSVFEASIAQETSDETAGVMFVDESGQLRVATGTRDIILHGLRQVNGTGVDVHDFVKKNGNRHVLNCTVSGDEQDYYLQSARSEEYWLEKFNSFDCGVNFSAINIDHAPRRIEWDTSLALSLDMHTRDNAEIVALVCAFVSRIRKADNYVVGVTYAHDGSKQYYLPRLPLVWGLAHDMRFAEIDELIKHQLAEMARHIYCPIDLFSRYVSLESERIGSNQYKFEISLVICNSSAEFEVFDPVLPTHGVVLVLDKAGRKWHLFSGESPDHELVSGFEKKLNRFISRVLEDTNARNTPISEISLLSEHEILLLEGVNQQDKDYPPTSAVAIFYDQAESNGGKTALIYEGSKYSYRQLRQRVDQIASQLIANNVEPGDRVGVLVLRSFDMVAALLAVMRVRAIYIPLDPIYPDDRLQYMIDDSGLKVLLTQSSVCNGLDRASFHSVNLDEIKDDDVSALDSVEFPSISESAYIIYTSGSTGKPKGVEVTHKGLTNFLLSMAEEPGFTAHDHLLSVTTVCFDIAGLELYLPLIQGGVVEICTAQDAKDGFALLEKLEAGEITVLQATPATWEMLIAAGWSRKLPLKALCGGEPLRSELAARLIPLCNELWNMYGPTETTIWSAIRRITETTQITIGAPIANTTMYVLDEYLNPVTISEKGELYIGGDGLARGYWQREELTSEKFIPNPLSAIPGDRLYRTGDAACYLKSGEFVCLGRIDNQIKLNGYRIELGEIEAAIESVSGIEKAVVVIEPGEQASALHAFLLYGNSAGTITEEGIKQNLRSVLPEYMVPGHFHEVYEFPLTLNGKVDRKALAAFLSETAGQENTVPGSVVAVADTVSVPVDAGTEIDNDTRHQMTALMRVDIVEMVKRLLNIGSVDSTLPFGQYGFNSLLFTRLSAELRNKYSIKVSPATYYTHVCVDNLCNYLINSKHLPELLNVYQDRLHTPHERTNADSITTPASRPDPVIAAPASSRKPVAIVGMALQMPQARNARAFWQNLMDGVDCVTEIPSSRWDWRTTEFGSGNSNPYKWGGFIPNIRAFDAAFFNISPREAELMDPQQRLFLQASYHALEDAGLSPEKVSGSNMGVYVGIVTSDYWDLLQRFGINPDGYTISGNINCVIANRVSYQFNLRGPSAVIDTACSSSLVAMHRAVRAIQSGECDSAIVGGVNVITSPYIHHSFSKNGMLSKTGRCMSFDGRANGYVRSEGVAAMVIKSLEQAELDGDDIYGVILGSSENHGGRTNSLSSPSGEAQCELIVKAVEAANIDVHTLSYIEAHGSGTPLGDPIEIDGIQRAYEKLRKISKLEPQSCGIGSVKSNIGHLEAVAGLAGLAKVLLALKNSMIPGMPMFSNQNKHIDICDTQFHFIDHNHQWIASGTSGQKMPRRAGVSSFGFGGVNAHVIVEEHTRRDTEISNQEVDNVLLLSARTHKQLRQLARDYLDYFQENGERLNWQNCCYTSQTGRTFFDERLLIEARGISEACAKLDAFICNEGTENRHICNNIKSVQASYFSVFNDVIAQDLIQPLLEKRSFSSLGRLWLAGIPFHWQSAYTGDHVMHKARLPLYPFDETEYWLPYSPTTVDVGQKNFQSPHPLIDDSPAPGVFVKQLDVTNPLIGDHVVDGTVIFPAVGYLEFARAAAEQLAVEENQGIVIALKGNVWLQALVVDDQQKTLEISFEGKWPARDYAIRSRDVHQNIQLHARGRIEVSTQPPAEPGREDIGAIKSRCHSKLDHESVYNLFSHLKFNYKDGYKPVLSVTYNSRESLAQIRLPGKFDTDYAKFALHPSLLEGGIQAVIGILANPEQDSDSAYLPFSMKDLYIYGALSRDCYVHAELTSDLRSAQMGIRKFNIRIFDLQGNCLVTIHEYILKTLHPDARRGSNNGKRSFLQIEKYWIESGRDQGGDLPGRVLVFSPTKEFARDITDQNLTIVVPGVEYRDVDDNCYVANPLDVHDLDALFSSLEQRGMLPDHIIYAWSYQADGAEERDAASAIESVINPFYTVCARAVRLLRKENSRIVFAYSSQTRTSPIYAGVWGLMKSLQLESSRIKATVVAMDGDIDSQVRKLIDEVTRTPDSIEVRHVGNVRTIPDYRILPVNFPEPDNKLPLGDGVCLVSGGTGGIGRRLVKHLHAKYGARIAILGRKALSESIRLEWKGIPYGYYVCDVSSVSDLTRIVAQIETEMGGITGVIHCAGGLADKLITNKSADETNPVISPKVKGIYALDEATRHCVLRFFYGFSSISAVMGNIGQTDYSYANAVVEEFCDWRNAQERLGNRHGRSISMSWPLWQDGGMAVSDSAARYFKEATGVEAIASSDGFDLLDYSLTACTGPLTIVSGNADQILGAVRKRSGLAHRYPDAMSKATADMGYRSQRYVIPVHAATDSLHARVEEILLTLGISILKLPPGKLNPDSVLSEMGFDSISNTELAAGINKTFGTDLTPIVFFEYSTLREVAGYLVQAHADAIESHFSNMSVDSARDAHQSVNTAGIQPFSGATSQPVLASSRESLRAELLARLKKIASGIVKVPTDEIDENVSISQYGFDSISNMEFIAGINSSFKTDVTPVVLFEYNRLTEIAVYLLDEFYTEISDELTGNMDSHHAPENGNAPAAAAGVTAIETIMPIQQVKPQFISVLAADHNHAEDDIAIIGMQALMPDSDDLDEFWSKLWEGYDFIREIPGDRWSWREYSGDANLENGKTRSRWGSFARDIDKFDADFFGIDPAEAALLDPQQRLFIQLVWHAIENAGYKVSDFAGTNTGLYAGLSNRDYADYLQQQGVNLSPGMSFGNNNAFLVNRVSYLFDFSGPSEPVDTLCSSSLVAIHRAVQDLKSGVCSHAIVGGISIIMSPRLSSVFEQANMLSAEGRCRSFDESADGFVRGEGGAAIVLKPLSKAINDNDNILAVIKGSHVNHGGRANALTAPNLKAQQRLIKEAYARSGIHPATVSYIEAHGTGTKIGDPIEITALKKAFAEFTNQESGVRDQACAIGTLKTNIGHLESASGIASVVKVLLGMKFRKQPGLLHLRKVNPYIDLKNSPFYLLNTRREWEPLVDSRGNNLPRRAGINAFGAGGVNAHVIIEEHHTYDRPEPNVVHVPASDPVLVILSAKYEQNLRTYARLLAKSLALEASALPDVAYTLQVGRDAFEHRLAIVATDRNAIIKSLNRFAETGHDAVLTYQASGQSGDSVPIEDVHTAIQRGDLVRLKDIWLKGETVDWRSLYAGKTMRRVPLPGYPFSRTRHWADKRNDTPVAGDAMVASSPGAPKFTNELPDWHADFYQRQPYLQEHKVFNDEVLLGVTYPSLALEAVRANSAIHDANRIQRVVFHSPLSFSADEHARVTIHMKRNGSGGVDFESTHHISGLAGPEKSSSGTISSTDRPATVIDLPPLVRGLSSGYGKQDVYALLRAQGVDYQGSLASVEKVLVGENHAVSMIYASDDLYRNTANYFLHPVWLDAAIVSAKFAFIHDPSALYIPFSVNDVVIYRQPDSRSYCVIKRSLLNEQILKCDVAICNHLGEVAIDAHGIVCKRILVNTPWKKTRQRMESA